MVTVPAPLPSTVTAIYEAYAASNESWDSLGLNVGGLGHECSRALWYDFRWASKPEKPPGKTCSIFRTGNAWEDRLVEDLSMIGVEVTDQQERIRLAGGHVRGKTDGRGVGLPEDPDTEHLFEFKSSNSRGYREIAKKGCRMAKPMHFAQCQLGMEATGCTWAGYMVLNKDTDERYFERIEHDPEYVKLLLEKAVRIVEAHEPPPRVSVNRSVPPCLFCRHSDKCHSSAFSRVNCRTCLHSTAHAHGKNAEWSCDLHVKPLSFDEQKVGCGSHVYLPSLVPGVVLNSDDASGTVTYELHDGRRWVDGITEDLDNGETDDR